MASGYSDLSEIRKASGQVYGLQQKPPKIDLLQEKPRRESLVEQQLSRSIVRVPVEFHQQPQLLSQASNQSQVFDNFGSQRTNSNNQGDIITGGLCTQSTKIYNGQVAYPSSSFSSRGQQDLERDINISHQRQSRQSLMSDEGLPYGQRTTSIKTTTTTSSTQQPLQRVERNPTYNALLAELSNKDSELKRELAYSNQYQNFWSRPRQFREPRKEPTGKPIRNDQRWVRECPNGPSSRPHSRASSTRSTAEEELKEKAMKLLQEAEEIKNKPLKMQQLLIENDAKWKSVSPSFSLEPQASSIHTAVIKVPTSEIDNKSPLPFSYDNFSTLGVRGNIASVGAAEPEKPYAPIFPVIKRTPSPNKRRY